MAQEQERLQFQAAIPGASLTTELGSRPWEKPARFPDPEDALVHYMDVLLRPEQMIQMVEILENGFPASALVNGIALVGVMNGLHSIDTSVIIAPALHQLIVGVAKEMGVDVTETSKTARVDPSLMIKAKKMSRATALKQETKQEMEQETIERISEATGIMARPVEDLPAEPEEENVALDLLTEEIV